MKRPGFQKMIAAIEAGYISAVFVKDLSRLGRNYIEVGKLTEEFFPLHDVRLVAVSDGVDSDEGEDDFTPFKNIMNEYYAKDISKKRRIVNKMKGNAGIPLSPPPYGYMKNPDDPRFWVIDPEAAEVVRCIYRLALEGNGPLQIATALGTMGALNPSAYRTSKGISKGGSKSTLEPTKWNHTTVKKILTLQEYCGDVINFKTYSKSYKMKRRIENPEENRAIFLNVHEPIIDRVTWEKVQSLQTTRRRRPTVTKESSAFCGYLKCPECGGNLTFHFNQNNHDIKFFSCNNHNSGLRKCSSTHYIRLDFLEQVVLYEIHRLACFANEYENDFIKAMVGRSAKVAENDRARKKRELDGLLARDGELDMLFERLYEDNVSGKIDDARFAKMSKRYEQEQGENAGRIKALRLELKKLEDKRMDVDTFLETVRRYTDATTITKRMVAELIQYIEVYPAVKEDGITNQRVTIHYNCIGAFEVPDRRNIPERDILLETRKGVALSYAPAQISIINLEIKKCGVSSADLFRSFNDTPYGLISSTACMIHIEYNEIASLHHLPVANLESTFRVAAGRVAAYFDFIIIGFKVFHIVAQLRRGIWQYPNQGTVVIPNKPLLAFDSGGNDLVKISVPSDQELHILLFQKQRMNQRLHTILRLTKLRDDPVSKKTNGKYVHGFIFAIFKPASPTK